MLWHPRIESIGTEHSHAGTVSIFHISVVAKIRILLTHGGFSLHKSFVLHTSWNLLAIFMITPGRNGQRYLFVISIVIGRQIIWDLIMRLMWKRQQMAGLIHIGTSIGRPVDTTNVIDGCFSNQKCKIDQTRLEKEQFWSKITFTIFLVTRQILTVVALAKLGV